MSSKDGLQGVEGAVLEQDAEGQFKWQGLEQEDHDWVGRMWNWGVLF